MVDEKHAGFWQVSDDVPADLVKKFIGPCTRKDCRISARILDTTLAGTVSYYDHAGNKVIENRNRMKIAMCCIECDKNEYVKTP